MRIFPAVMALAKNMQVQPCIEVFCCMQAPNTSMKSSTATAACCLQGFASFARLMGDESDEMRGIMDDLNVLEVRCKAMFQEHTGVTWGRIGRCGG